MKKLPLIVQIKNLLLAFVDLLLLPLVLFSFLFIKPFFLVGLHNLPLSRNLFRKLSFFPLKNHYYQPYFGGSKGPWESRLENLPGIDLRIDKQILLLKSFSYASEFTSLYKHSISLSPPTVDNLFGFLFGNSSFEAGDAEFLYQIIRHFKPSLVIEIGSGNSTRIAASALKKNYLENRNHYSHVCIEPYQNEWIADFPNITHIRKKLEHVPSNRFHDLKRNDILFIDSSHMIRPNGDVILEYLSILPRLNPGVIVHIHDIFTPYDYPPEWYEKYTRFWNEQYILESLISCSNRFEVLASVHYLKRNYYNALSEVCPFLKQSSSPGSFYLRVI